MKLLITDLDNTLYDWVTFYSLSFEAMVSELSKEIGIPLSTLLNEYKAVHQRFGNSEKPFATLELPSVIKYFGTSDKLVLQEKLTNVLGAFSRKRKETLKLYPGVFDTLSALKDRNVKIVGHTEALEFNSLYRLHKLGLTGLFDRLYTLEDKHNLHPNPSSAYKIDIGDDFVMRLPASESKPNPRLLEHICCVEGVHTKEAVYIGDSLTKDISMANEVGMTSVWANYGRTFSPKCWDILVRITHWTDEDVAKEEELKRTFFDVKPDYKVDCFSDLLKLND